jgi:hypothetical protein
VSCGIAHARGFGPPAMYNFISKSVVRRDHRAITKVELPFNGFLKKQDEASDRG